MKHYADLRIGVATHTGRVRRTNEDDYLVFMPQDPERLQRSGRLLAVADGMGGAAGGAEASRAALRALATAYVEPNLAQSPMQRARLGFQRASQRLLTLARETPSLAGMGTTLTILNLCDDRAVVGHVGDSRCYRLRGGELVLLTEDHALPGQTRLTRCIGANREETEVDVSELDLQSGDRFLLCTDGLWEGLAPDDIVRMLGRQEAQAAATDLVRAACACGGADNATAVVVHVVTAGGQHGELIDVALPAGEIVLASELRLRQGLRRPIWPWFVLGCAVLLTILTIGKIVYGVDVIAALRR